MSKKVKLKNSLSVKKRGRPFKNNKTVSEVKRKKKSYKKSMKMVQISLKKDLRENKKVIYSEKRAYNKKERKRIKFKDEVTKNLNLFHNRDSEGKFLKKKNLDKNDKSKELIYGTKEFESELLKKMILIKPMVKLNCISCKKDLTNQIRITTITFKDYCFNCLIELKANEDYFVFDNLDYPIFNSKWTVFEEIFLLNCIEKFGLDNWSDISQYLKSKPRLSCEAHYYEFYLKQFSLPNDKDVCFYKQNILNKEKNKENLQREEDLRKQLLLNQGIIPDLASSKENKNSNRSRSLVKNRNKKEGQNVNPEEIVGYWPRREEFDIEHLNEAEIEIAELEFLEEDTKEEREMKLKVLEIYNQRLREREKRKKFVIDRNLLDVKKLLNYERKLPKDEREIFNTLRPYTRLFTQEEFESLYDAIILQKILKQRLNQLKFFASQGLETYQDVNRFLETEVNKNKEKSIFFN